MEKKQTTPIFKKGDKKQALNYGPFNLKLVVSKLVDKIIRDKLIAVLETNKLITENHHGFRNNRSCLTNLLDFFSVIYGNWDVRLPCDVI